MHLFTDLHILLHQGLPIKMHVMIVADLLPRIRYYATKGSCLDHDVRTRPDFKGFCCNFRLTCTTVFIAYKESTCRVRR